MMRQWQRMRRDSVATQIRCAERETSRQWPSEPATRLSRRPRGSTRRLGLAAHRHPCGRGCSVHLAGDLLLPIRNSLRSEVSLTAKQPPGPQTPASLSAAALRYRRAKPPSAPLANSVTDSAGAVEARWPCTAAVDACALATTMMTIRQPSARYADAGPSRRRMMRLIRNTTAGQLDLAGHTATTGMLR